MTNGHYVYILRCADDTLYTGYTTSLPDRIAAHDDGEGSKYTRGRTPVEPVYAERFSEQSAALRREHEIKSLTRPEKDALVAGDRKAVGTRLQRSDLPAPD